MEERSWVRRADREMEFWVRKSSRGRFWNGFEATLYDASGGFSEQAFAQHSLSMHVGTPMLITSRCDGALVHRLQVPGDMKIVPAGFSRVWETEGATSKLVINIQQHLVRETAVGMGVNPDRAAIAPQLHIKDEQAEHIAWALKAELESDHPIGRLYADSLGLALTAHLLKRYAPATPQRIGNQLPRRRLRRVIDYINGHLNEDLGLAELAAVARMSSSHFKVLFKGSVGMPVHQYLIRRRVEYAMELLVRGTSPICDVALQAGFADQSHMARCMRRLTGYTPAAVLRDA
ncbi:MAG: helix-turn-helix transcriptional regulator [Candidatus Eremiobacteraeota bacterium]|nr:helix-turn-helix transcriptional regulator [Candidatus Eremiobacteraeota bacterium]